MLRRDRNRHALAVLLSLAAALSAPSAHAGVPDWLRQAAAEPLPKYPDDTKAVVLLDEQVTTVSPSGEITSTYRRAYKILRPEGRVYGRVAVPFDTETRLTF